MNYQYNNIGLVQISLGYLDKDISHVTKWLWNKLNPLDKKNKKCTSFGSFYPYPRLLKLHDLIKRPSQRPFVGQEYGY